MLERVIDEDSVRMLHELDLPGRARFLLGLTGPPGSGKSTLAERLAAQAPVRAAVLAMDGFHLPNAVLDARGLRPRKGSPPSFDAHAFLAALQALRRGEPTDVPIYDRTIHEPRPAAAHIAGDVPLIIVEGNYLLLEAEPWRQVRLLLDACWYLDMPVDECLQRVRQRHLRGGCTPEQADHKIEMNDRENAAIIAATRSRADRIIGLGPEA
jgi:pantothenate kinase